MLKSLEISKNVCTYNKQMNKLYYFGLLTKKYNLPNDISHYIWYLVKNMCVQVIIDRWYAYIKFAHTDHIDRICKLRVIYAPFFPNWFDPFDKYVVFAFEKLEKYLSTSMIHINNSSGFYVLEWWSNYLNFLDYGLWMREHDGGPHSYLYNRVESAFIRLISRIYPWGWESLRGLIYKNVLWVERIRMNIQV